MTDPKPIKLSQKRNGLGYVTSYTVNIGCAEARELGFLDTEGNQLPLEKLVDPDTGTITIRRAT